MIHFDPKPSTAADTEKQSVCAIGIGGAGCNILDRLALGKLPQAELVSMSADVRVLNNSMAQRKVQLGEEITRGLGAGGDPELGRQLAEATTEEIGSAVNDRSIVLICAGLGGGTGSGVTPFVVEQARAAGAFVVVFAVLPFPFEGRRRAEQAEASLQELESASDVLVTFENARMGELALPKEGIQGAFAAADETLGQSIRAVASIVLRPGIIRVGLDDLTSALRNKSSRCLFGYGEGQGDARATNALQKALKSPLLDNGTDLKSATTILAHVAGGNSMSLYEVELVMTELAKHVSDDANLLFGTATDKSLGEKMVVTLVSSLAAKVESQEAFLVEAEPVSKESAPEPEPEREAKEETPVEHGESVAQALAAITASVASKEEPGIEDQFALDFGFEPEEEQAEEPEEAPTAQDLQEEEEVIAEVELPEPQPKEPVVIESLVIEDAVPSVATSTVPTADIAEEEPPADVEAVIEEEPEAIAEEPIEEPEPIAAEAPEEEPIAVEEIFAEETPEPIEDPEPFLEVAAAPEKKLSLVDRLLQNREAFFAEETETEEEDNAGFGEALLQEEEETSASVPPVSEEFTPEPEPEPYEPVAAEAPVEEEPEPESFIEEPKEVEEAIAAFEEATDPATLEESEPTYYEEPEPQVAAKGAGQSMLEFGHAATSGRFQNADPTLSEEGDDLDIPTFLRKRMAKG